MLWLESPVERNEKKNTENVAEKPLQADTAG
jgi:hypothetical protein